MPTENYSHSAKFTELLNSTYKELHWGLEEDGKGPVKQTKQTHKTTNNKHQNQFPPTLVTSEDYIILSVLSYLF